MQDKDLDLRSYYNEQYNARASIPDHPYIFTRWKKESAHIRRTHAGLYDLHFGEAPEERLDLFPSRRAGAPLLVFIHGGWWRSLDKSDFSFLAPAYLRAGYSVALTNYTLAPATTIEEIVRQQLRALSWLYRHAEDYDFDRERIVVAGHSAGGHLAAMMMAARWPLLDPALPVDLVKGGVLMSGLYDLEPVRHADFVNVDLKLEPQHIAPLSPGYMTPAHAAPFVTAVGALESEEFHRQSRLLAEGWRASHAGSIALPGINHLTICDEFGREGSALFEATLKLLRES